MGRILLLVLLRYIRQIEYKYFNVHVLLSLSLLVDFIVKTLFETFLVNKHHPTQMHWNISNTKHMHFNAIYCWKWFGSWKNTHLINTLFLRICLFVRICWFLVTKSYSGMNFVSHQNSCFAPLSDLTSRCSFDQQPMSGRATLLHLYYHKMHI